MSVAQLGFQIDSTQAANAASDLDKLTSSAARAEQAAQKTGAAGTRMSKGFADLTPALDKIIGSLSRLEASSSSIDRRLDTMASAATRASKATQVLDKSAIEASTAYKQLEASLNAVTAAQKRGDAAQATSLAMIQKQKDAIASLNAELQKLRTAPVPVPGGQNRPSAANSNFQTSNVASQLFDIGSTAAFMNPLTVGLQQGPQLAQAFMGQSGKEALKGLAAGIGAIISPVSLAAIGLTTAASAAISFGAGMMSAEDKTKKLDDALERHDGILKRLEQRYGSLVEKAKGFSAEGANILRFDAGSDIRGLTNATRVEGNSFFNTAGTVRPLVRGGGDFAVGREYTMFGEALRKLREEAKSGRPDFDAFYDSLYKTASINPDYAKKADELGKLIERYREGTQALEEMQRVQNAIFNDRGPNGMLLSQGPTAQADSTSLTIWENQQRVAAQRRQQGLNAQLDGINARSPQERAAAARAAAAAQYNNDETGTARRARIDQAGVIALAQAERQLADAQRDRRMGLDKILQDQQQEIDLVGKTGGAAAALRKEYELTSALRMEAARQGINVDQRELELIHQKAQALGQLTDQYNQARFTFDMNQQINDAHLDARSRQIVQTQRQYGLPENVNSDSGQRIGQQYDWTEAKSFATQFGSVFGNTLVSNSGDIGEAFGKALQNSLANLSQKLMDSVFDSLGNAFADAITGKSSGSGGLIDTVVKSVLGKSANDNTAGAFSGLGKLATVERSALPDIGSYAKAIQSIESGGNYGALGPITRNGDRAYGAYQMMGNNIGPWSRETLGHTITAEEFLKNPSMQDQIFQNKFGGYVDKYGASGAAQAWFGGPGSVGKGGMGADVLGTTGNAYVEKFNNALSGMSDSAGSATGSLGTLGTGIGSAAQGLGNLGSGFNQFGQNLTSFFPSAPSGGGGGLGLFGTIQSWFSPDLSKYIGLTGMFANGTNYAPGGLALVGEAGPELVNLPQGSSVTPNHKLSDMMRGGNSGVHVTSDVRVSVDNDGNLKAYVERTSSRVADQKIDTNNRGEADRFAAYNSNPRKRPGRAVA